MRNLVSGLKSISTRVIQLLPRLLGAFWLNYVHPTSLSVLLWLKQISGLVLDPLLPFLHSFWLYYTSPASFFSAVLSCADDQSRTFSTPFSRIHEWLVGAPLIVSNPRRLLGSTAVASVIFIVATLALAPVDTSSATEVLFRTGIGLLDDALLAMALQFAAFFYAGIIALFVWPFVRPLATGYRRLFLYWATSLLFFVSSVIMILFVFVWLGYVLSIVMDACRTGAVLSLSVYKVVTLGGLGLGMLILLTSSGYSLLINPLRVLPHLCGVGRWRVAAPLAVLALMLVGFGVAIDKTSETPPDFRIEVVVPRSGERCLKLSEFPKSSKDVCFDSKEGEQVCRWSRYVCYGVKEKVLALSSPEVAKANTCIGALPSLGKSDVENFVSILCVHSKVLRLNKELTYFVKIISPPQSEESCSFAWEYSTKVKQFLVKEGVPPDRIHLRVLIHNRPRREAMALAIFHRKELWFEKVSPFRLCCPPPSDANCNSKT